MFRYKCTIFNLPSKYIFKMFFMWKINELKPTNWLLLDTSVSVKWPVAWKFLFAWTIHTINHALGDWRYQHYGAIDSFKKCHIIIPMQRKFVGWHKLDIWIASNLLEISQFPKHACSHILIDWVNRYIVYLNNIVCKSPSLIWISLLPV